MSAIDELLAHHCALPLGSRCLLRFRGPDHLRYLNGQLTNDLRAIPPGQALHSCVTDAKGRLLAELRVFDHDESLWVDAPAELRDSLPGRLDRYLVADEVEWTDESAHWRLLHLARPRISASPPAGALSRESNRLGIPGLDIWLPSEDQDSWQMLIDEFGTLVPEQAETIRIALGVPAWGAELTEGMLPPEAGLDRSAISYTKGCYIGQEVLSRLHSIGRVNRQLVRLQLDAAADPANLAGSELHDPDRNTTAGRITSVSPLILAGDRHRNALGYRARQFEQTGSFEIITPAATFPAVARALPS